MKTPSSRLAALSLLAAFSGVGVLCSSAAAQSFTFVNPGGLAYASYGLSADGTRAAGGTSIGNGNSGAFSWSQSSGYSVFGLEPGVRANSEARAISGDGQVIYGNAGFDTNAAGVHAFRWTGPGTYHELPTAFGYTSSFIRGTDGDGGIAVGYEQFGREGNGTSTQACYWSGDTITLLETQISSQALGISRDGSSIVGFDDQVAVVWHPGGARQELPDLSNLPGGQSGLPRAVNADGTVIVGNSGSYAARWVNGQVGPLFRPNGVPVLGAARAVSDDGSVIVGSFRYDTPQYTAGIWTLATGAIPLADYLTQNGVSLPQGITLTDVFAVSADGRTFAGSSSQGAYVATVPVPGVAACLLAAMGMTFVRRARCSSAGVT